MPGPSYYFLQAVLVCQVRWHSHLILYLRVDPRQFFVEFAASIDRLSLNRMVFLNQLQIHIATVLKLPGQAKWCKLFV